MNSDRESLRHGLGQLGRGASNSVGGTNDTGIGAGKKVGLYGMGLLLLGLIIVAVVMYMTGYYAPFEGTEGVGP